MKRGPKPKVKLDMFAVNNLVKAATDVLNDMSLAYREQAQMVQLQRQKLIEQEKLISDIIKKNESKIVDAALEHANKESESSGEPETANLKELFGDSQDNSNVK